MWCCSHVAPKSCPSVAPIFDVGSPGKKKKKTSLTKDKKNRHLSPKEPVTVVQLLHLQLSCLNSLKTTEGGKGAPTPKSNLPDNKATTAVKIIPKNTNKWIQVVDGFQESWQ